MTGADFWHAYRAVRRHIWVAVGIIVTTTVVVVAGALLLPRHYEARATVLPSEQALTSPLGSGVSGSRDMPAWSRPEERRAQLPNLIALIHSGAMKQRVQDAQRLPPDKDLYDLDVSVLRTKGGEATVMLEIIVGAPTPELAVDIANSHAKEFADFYQGITHQDAIQARQFLESRQEVAREELAGISKQIEAFRRQHPNLPDATIPIEGADPLEQQRVEVEAQLLETRAKLNSARAQLRTIQPTKVTEAGTTKSPAVVELQQRLAKLEADLATESAVRTADHWRVVELQAQVKNLRERLTEETGRVLSHRTIERNPLYDRLFEQVVDLESGVASLAAKLRGLDAAVKRRRQRATEGAVSGVRFAGLRREQKLAEDRYATLSSAAQQARLNERLTTRAGAIRVVDWAAEAKGPVSKVPYLPHLAALAILLSVVLAIGTALGLEFLDNRVRTSVDAQRLLQLPVTGIIPATEGSPRELPQYTHLQPLSPVAEAYRFLRTDLLFTARDHPLQSIMVATAKPGHGGTTTISNLAIAMAQAGKRVVLVDADLRRPRLHEVFGVENETGLTDVLHDELLVTDVLKSTAVDNLLLLPAGSSTRHPSELLASERMKQVLDTLKAYSDFVFFDVPSAIAFADAAILSSLMDGVLIVVRANQAPRGSELQMRGLLNKAKANVIGVVLNDADPDTVDSCYFHSHYYQPADKARGKSDQQLPTTTPAIRPPGADKEGPPIDPKSALRGRPEEGPSESAEPAEGES